MTVVHVENHAREIQCLLQNSCLYPRRTRSCCEALAKAGLRFVAPKDPKFPPTSGRASCTLRGFCGNVGPRGLQVRAQETWFSSHFTGFTPVWSCAWLMPTGGRGSLGHVWDNPTENDQRGWQERGCWCTVWEHGLRGWIASCFYSIIVSVKS